MMRRILSFVWLLTLSLAVTSSSGFAQSFPTDKGSMIIGGGFHFTSAGGDAHENVEGDRSTSIGLDPSLSYFFNPGLALGGKVIFERFSQGDYSSNSWGVGPQIWYFIGGNQPKDSVKGSTYPYVRVAFLYTKHTVEYDSDDYSYTWMRTGFRGGILHMLSNAVGIFGEAAYSIDSFKPEDEDSESGNRFNIFVGITHFIY